MEASLTVPLATPRRATKTTFSTKPKSPHSTSVQPGPGPAAKQAPTPGDPGTPGKPGRALRRLAERSVASRLAYGHQLRSLVQDAAREWLAHGCAGGRAKGPVLRTRHGDPPPSVGKPLAQRAAGGTACGLEPIVRLVRPPGKPGGPNTARAGGRLKAESLRSSAGVGNPSPPAPFPSREGGAEGGRSYASVFMGTSPVTGMAARAYQRPQSRGEVTDSPPNGNKPSQAEEPTASTPR